MIVSLDGSLAVSCRDVPVSEKETSAGCHDFRPVRMQHERNLQLQQQPRSESESESESASERTRDERGDFRVRNDLPDTKEGCQNAQKVEGGK